MRKEADLKEWKRLYDLGIQFMEKMPWKYLFNDEYICIRFSEDEEAYFTVMGNGEMEFGFGMYIGEIPFREMNLQMNASHEACTDEYSFFLQNCLTMFADMKKDVPKEQMAVIKQLKLDFGRGRKWVYFENHARGYLPYIPDRTDVLTLIRYMEQLLPCLDLIKQVTSKSGIRLMGQGYVYKAEGGSWNLHKVFWNTEELCRLPLLQTDGHAKKVCSTWKRLKTVWEIDLVLLNSRIDDKDFDRPLYPYMLLVVDHGSGTVVYQNLLMPESGIPEICSELTELMQAHGRPKKILVTGSVMKEMLSALGELTDVPIKKSPLNNLMQFKEGLLHQIAAGSIDGHFFEDFIKNIGLTPDEIKSLLKTANAESEEDLFNKLAERVMMMENGSGGVFFENPFSNADDDWDMDDDWDAEDDEPDLIIRESLTTIPRKIQWIRSFFETSFPYQEESEEDEDSLDEWDDEDLADGIIDASLCDDWVNIIGLCKKETLKNTAEKIGILAEKKKKAELAEEVYRSLSAKPGKVKEFLSEDERRLIKHLRTMANKGTCSDTEDFPFSYVLLTDLIEKGMIDIEGGHSSYAQFLTIKIPKELKGIRL